MKLVLDQPWMKPYDPANDVRVLIACEDSTFAEPACALMECVGRDCGPEGRLIYRWWNFELLAINSLREVACHEAAAADLVIVAAHESDRLAPGITNWITRWLELRQGRSGALVALIASNPETPGAPHAVFSKLKASAARGHMDFYAATCDPEAEREIDAWFSKPTRSFIMTSISRSRNPEARRRGRRPQPRTPSYRTACLRDS